MYCGSDWRGEPEAVQQVENWVRMAGGAEVVITHWVGGVSLLGLFDGFGEGEE